MAYREFVTSLPPVGMLMAVRAKKHITVFNRSMSAPGAGSPAQKAKFAGCAKGTKGIKDRLERNAKISSCLGGKKK